MRDQVAEQSPQSRLEAMLGDDIVSDVQANLDAPEEKKKKQQMMHQMTKLKKKNSRKMKFLLS